jgi:hypothetical protein
MKPVSDLVEGSKNPNHQGESSPGSLGILGFIDDLGLLGQIGLSLMGERGPDDITG